MRNRSAYIIGDYILVDLETCGMVFSENVDAFYVEMVWMVDTLVAFPSDAYDALDALAAHNSHFPLAFAADDVVVALPVWNHLAEGNASVVEAYRIPSDMAPVQISEH